MSPPNEESRVLSAKTTRGVHPASTTELDPIVHRKPSARYVPATPERIETLITQIGQDTDNRVWAAVDRERTLAGLRDLLTLANRILVHHKNRREVADG